MSSIILTKAVRPTYYEDGLRHVERHAGQGVYGRLYDLACRNLRGGNYHYPDDRIVEEGPPTCLWCLAAR